jgi:hypothetical protein
MRLIPTRKASLRLFMIELLSNYFADGLRGGTTPPILPCLPIPSVKSLILKVSVCHWYGKNTDFVNASVCLYNEPRLIPGFPLEMARSFVSGIFDEVAGKIKTILNCLKPMEIVLRHFIKKHQMTNLG